MRLLRSPEAWCALGSEQFVIHHELIIYAMPFRKGLRGDGAGGHYKLSLFAQNADSSAAIVEQRLFFV